jgi:hypothetical protein
MAARERRDRVGSKEADLLDAEAVCNSTHAMLMGACARTLMVARSESDGPTSRPGAGLLVPSDASHAGVVAVRQGGFAHFVK